MAKRHKMAARSSRRSVVQSESKIQNLAAQIYTGIVSRAYAEGVGPCMDCCIGDSIRLARQFFALYESIGAEGCRNPQLPSHAAGHISPDLEDKEGAGEDL